MIVEIAIGVGGLILAAASVYYGRKQVLLAREALEPPTSKTEPTLNSQSFFDENKYRATLRQDTSFIDIRGIAAQDPASTSSFRVPIDEVYAQLFVKAGLTERETDLQADMAPVRVTLTDVVRATRCTVLMGDPGAGKTTFLRFLAHKLLDDVSCKWPCGDGAFSADCISAEECAVLPFVVPLSEFRNYLASLDTIGANGTATALGRSDPSTLLQYVLASMSKMGVCASRANILPIIESGRAIWLFDGMDEIASLESRKRLAEIIAQASVAWPTCRFVVTSRPFAVAGLTRPKDFEVCSIDVLQDTEIERFLASWTKCLFSGASEEKRQEHLAGLTRAILENAELRTLARNPVMLTCMAVLHYNRKRLPNSKADLLEAVVQWLLFSRHDGGEPHEKSPEQVESKLRLLAYLMLSQQGNRYQAGVLWAAQQLLEHFGGDTGQWLAFLQEERQVSGVIIGRGEGDITFWHSWFQQYLAAKHIANATDDVERGWWHLIAQHLDDNQWHEVLSLVPACLRRLGTARVDLFFQRLIDDVAGAELDAQLRRYGLAGSILQDLRAVGFEVDNRIFSSSATGMQEIFRTYLGNVPLQCRFHAAAALGIVGDSRLALSPARWVTIEAGQSIVGAQREDPSAPNYDPLAVSWEGPVHSTEIEQFEISTFLVTVQDYARFVQDSGYSNTSWWSDPGWKWRKRNSIGRPLAWEDQVRLPNCPVTGISWFEAIAYCNWMRITSDDGYDYCLPTECEWERAARIRIPRGQRFPWGNTLRSGDAAEANWALANLRSKSPVGMFPLSTTADGISDLFGNVEEWCLDVWNDRHYVHAAPDFRHVTVPEATKRVVRGGSTIRPMRFCRPSYRSQILQTRRYMTVGFRVVRKRTAFGPEPLDE